jgi:hypothetical protein
VVREVLTSVSKELWMYWREKVEVKRMGSTKTRIWGSGVKPRVSAEVSALARVSAYDLLGEVSYARYKYQG